MNERKLVEQLAAEIEKATAACDERRAQKLADLQCDVLLKILLGSIADPARPPLLASGRP
jgi:hypothetical protein